MALTKEYVYSMLNIQLSMMRPTYQTQSIIQIWGSTETSIGKIKSMIDDAGAASKNEQILLEKDVTNEIDFMDLYSHQI